MKKFARNLGYGLLALGILSLAAARPVLAGTESAVWDSYLDYAYVYVSADEASLRARLPT